MSSYLRLRHNRFPNRLSIHGPDILGGGELPLSVLEISGGWVPLASATCQAWKQKAASSVLLNSHASTWRLHQSITAIRYMNPCFIGIEVMSAHQTWLGPVIAFLLNK